MSQVADNMQLRDSTGRSMSCFLQALREYRGGWHCTMLPRVMLLFLASTLGAASSASGPADPAFALTEVAAGIFVHGGRQVGREHPARDDIANLVAVVGERCVAVIDTGGSVQVGERFRRALDGITTLPVCYVVNTHVHYDHLLGNVAFAADAPEIIGHEKLEGAVAGSRLFFADQFARELGGADQGKRVLGPSRLVSLDEPQRLDLGSRVLVLTAWEGAHTYTDLTVFDENTSTLIAGDLLFMQRLPILDGSLRGWLRAIESLQAIDARLVVPGHGPLKADWPAALDAQREYLASLLTQTRAAVAEGAFLEDALENVGQEQRENWQLFEGNHTRNVSRAFKELEWE